MLLYKISYLFYSFLSSIENIIYIYNKSLINVFELFEKVKVLKKYLYLYNKIN